MGFFMVQRKYGEIPRKTSQLVAPEVKLYLAMNLQNALKRVE